MTNDYEMRLRALERELNRLAASLAKQSELAGQTRQQLFTGLAAIGGGGGTAVGGFAVTPSGGIAAATLASGTYTPGSAACELWDGTTSITDSGNPITVYNAMTGTGGAVGGSKLVMFVYISGVPFVVSEPC